MPRSPRLRGRRRCGRKRGPPEAVGPLVGSGVGGGEGALPHLWVLISKLVHVKVWAVSGGVKGGIPAFGLAEAGVSVTFGRKE